MSAARFWDASRAQAGLRLSLHKTGIVSLLHMPFNARQTAGIASIFPGKVGGARVSHMSTAPASIPSPTGVPSSAPGEPTPSQRFRPVFSSCDRVAGALGSAVLAFIDPARADSVALLGDLTGERALKAIKARLEGCPSGRQILATRPRLRALPLAPLRALPPTSFGRVYVDYLDRYGFDPDERHDVKGVEDPDLAYVLQRYREVHDFWHVLSGLPPSLLGETAVKWLEMVQTGLPMTALAALVGPLRLPPSDRRLLRRVYIPWAVTTGRVAVDLLSVDYEGYLWDEVGGARDVPLVQVYRDLRFTPAPPLPSAR